MITLYLSGATLSLASGPAPQPIITLNAIEYIQQRVLDDSRYITSTHPLHVFTFAGDAFELLGACLDDQPFSQRGLSNQRTLAGLELASNGSNYYSNLTNREFLATNLRNGMSHVLKPLDPLYVTNEVGLKSSHLQNPGAYFPTNTLLIHADCLLDDIQFALNNLSNNSSIKVNNMTGKTRLQKAQEYTFRTTRFSLKIYLV